MKERTCECCGESFFPKKKKQQYCCRECKVEASPGGHKTTWATRLHDGMRLLSDDFGEIDGDDLVTFQK